jgi:RNase P protein component
MVPRQNRIPSSEITSLAKTGKKQAYGVCTVSYRLSPSPVSRFAIRVPLRLDKRSTRRHAMKRMLIAAVLTSLPGLGKPVDMLITARVNFSGEAQEKLNIQVRTMLENITTHV